MLNTISSSLQESVLTLLATNSEQGRIAAGLLKPEFFDDDYRDIASRVLSYTKRHGKAPGREHLDDLFDDVLSSKNNKRKGHYVRVIEGILGQADGLNAGYVLSRVSEFSRLQGLKKAWFDAADIIEGGKEGAVEEVENLWYKALRTKQNTIGSPIFLNDKKQALAFLDRVDNHYLTGIKPLDRVGLAPTPGAMLLFMAAKGAGKSWFAIHCGRQCLLQRAKVVHITLEMPAWQVIQRYYQNIFSIPKRRDKFKISHFEFDDLKRLTGLRSETIKPKVSLADKDIRKYLSSKLEDWGVRFKNLVVGEFPAGYLTVPILESFLDNLEMQYKFIPNVLIVDYPDLMKIREDDHRISLGRTFVDLRGLLQSRNLAGIMPTQGNRQSWDAKTVKGSMVAEDATKWMTTDMGVIYSQTPQEYERGLARLWAEKNRGDKGKFSVIITQNYDIGQFALNSVKQHTRYWDLLKEESHD